MLFVVVEIAVGASVFVDIPVVTENVCLRVMFVQALVLVQPTN